MPAGAMMEIGFAIVTGPYPAESLITTSPPEAVRLIATANDRHGALTEQALASSPSPETKVR